MAPSSADIYKNNLALLKKNHPHIHELITKANHPLTGEIVSARNGHPALKIQKSDGDTVVLYDETTDETDIGFVPEDFYGLVYLVGMGMGYTAISLVQQKPDMRFLAIFEPDAEIFSQVLHVTDLSPVLTDHRVIISIGVNPDLNKVLAPARNVLMTESLCYRKHAPSMALDPAYEILVKHVFDYASLYVISGGTIHSYGRFFFSNRLRNFATMHHGALVDSLVGAFSGKPAILVGAGPSLNKNVQYLQYAKGKAVIIAVDSALPALVQNGVLPDFITTVDAFEFSYEKIADQAPFARGTALICTPTVNIKAPKTFPADHVFWAFTENETEKWLSAILASKITIEGVETVAHLNLFSALIMGCSPIIFVGQDLAYSASESHAAHTVLSSKNLMKEDLRSHNKVVWVKGVSGDNVPTGLAYYNMKRFFENIIRKHKGVFLNATEGGAHIEGTEIVTLKEVLKNVCVHFIDVSGQIKSASNKAVKKSIDDIHKEIAVEIKKASSIKSKLAETLKLTDTILKNLSKLRPKEESRKWTRIDDLPTHITNNMRKSDALNNSLDKSLGLWNKLTEITIECLKFSERMRHKMTWLEQGKGKFIDWLIAREERLRYINQYRKDVLETYETFLGKITETYDKESSASLSPDKGLDEMHDRLYDLAVHYFNQGDMNLAKSTLNQLDEETSNKAELQFYKGCIALNHIEYQDAETYFASAKSMDQSMEERERLYGVELGNAYLGYSRREDIDTAAARRLLVKGLRYCPWHEEIIKAIQSQFDSDFSDIENRIKEAPDDVMTVIDSWLSDLSFYKELKKCLDPERMGELYALYGRILMIKESFEEAERKFSKALEHNSENPYFHVLIADAYFAQDKYNLGVMHLNKAVELDRSYGRCWEDIGDALFDQTQYGDALSAYEMCFKATPENHMALKKMGDCYQQLGKPEAAKEAHKQYERLIQKSSS